MLFLFRRINLRETKEESQVRQSKCCHVWKYGWTRRDGGKLYSCVCGQTKIDYSKVK